MKNKISFDARQLSFNFRVRLEPALQAVTAEMTPVELEAQALIYERWVHQCRLKARLLRAHLQQARNASLLPLLPHGAPSLHSMAHRN